MNAPIENISLEEIINARENIAPLFPLELLATPPHRFDFSKNNRDIKKIDMNDVESLESHIEDTLKKNHKRWGLGGWGEDRFLYQVSPLFKAGAEYRCIHLGLDIWLPMGTPLFA